MNIVNCDVTKDPVQTKKCLKTYDNTCKSEIVKPRNLFFTRKQNAVAFFPTLPLGIPRNPAAAYEYVVPRHSLVKVCCKSVAVVFPSPRRASSPSV